MDFITQHWVGLAAIAAAAAWYGLGFFVPGKLAKLAQLSKWADLVFDSIELVGQTAGWDGASKLREYEKRIRELAGRAGIAIRKRDWVMLKEIATDKANARKLALANLEYADKKLTKVIEGYALPDQRWKLIAKIQAQQAIAFGVDTAPENRRAAQSEIVRLAELLEKAP